MFKSSQVFAARAGRVAFGAYLIAGALTLVSDFASPGLWGMGVSELFVWSWIIAFAMGYSVRKLVGARPTTEDRWLLASLVVPGIGLALMMPLLVHLPIVALLGGASGFDSWFRTSLVIVGPTHVLLAVLVTMRAIGLVRQRELSIGSYTPTPGFIYVACVVFSLFSSLGLLLIPTFIVALTGCAIVPVLRHMATIVESERALLPGVPRAIALAVRA